MEPGPDCSPDRCYVVTLVGDEHGGPIIRTLLPAVEDALDVLASGSTLPLPFPPIRWPR